MSRMRIQVDRDANRYPIAYNLIDTELDCIVLRTHSASVCAYWAAELNNTSKESAATINIVRNTV